MDDMKFIRRIVIGFILSFVFGFILSFAIAWTYTWDCAVPVGTMAPSVIDDYMRNDKYAIAERLNIDHIFGLTGTEVSATDTGYHRDIHFYSTTATDPVLDFTTVGGIDELRYTDSAGSAVQITSAGILKAVNLTGTQTVAGDKTFSGATSFGSQITSTLADGTAPFAVTSTTKVTNLNADKWDGYDVSTYSGGQSATIAGGLIIKAGSVNSTSDDNQTFTFSAAFPNDCISVVNTQTASGGTSEFPIVTISAASFIVNRNDAIDGTVALRWIAVGY